MERYGIYYWKGMTPPKEMLLFINTIPFLKTSSYGPYHDGCWGKYWKSNPFKKIVDENVYIVYDDKDYPYRDNHLVFPGNSQIAFFNATFNKLYSYGLYHGKIIKVLEMKRCHAEHFKEFMFELTKDYIDDFGAYKHKTKMMEAKDKDDNLWYYEYVEIFN